VWNFCTTPVFCIVAVCCVEFCQGVQSVTTKLGKFASMSPSCDWVVYIVSLCVSSYRVLNFVANTSAMTYYVCRVKRQYVTLLLSILGLLTRELDGVVYLDLDRKHGVTATNSDVQALSFGFCFRLFVFPYLPAAVCVILAAKPDIGASPHHYPS